MARLAAEIRKHLVLTSHAVGHAGLLVDLFVVGGRGAGVESALLAVVEVAGLAQGASARTDLTVLSSSIGIVTRRTGADATIGGPVEVVAQRAHVGDGAVGR